MIEDLLGKPTVKRRKAAIHIRKNILTEYRPYLLEALKLEQDKKHNETIIELISAIGTLGNNPEALSYIKENYLDKKRFLQDSSMAYIRLKRTNNNDVSSVIDFINGGDYSMMLGALEVLGYDKVVPTIEEQEYIINKCYDFGKDRLKGLTDPRYGLAAACAGWSAANVEPFLQHCLQSSDTPLLYVAENSLKKKYVRLR